MKQNNFFTSLSPLARTTLIICLIALPILTISTVFIVLAATNNKDSNNTNQVVLSSTSTIIPSVMSTPNATRIVITNTLAPTQTILPTNSSKIYISEEYNMKLTLPNEYDVSRQDWQLSCSDAKKFTNINTTNCTDAIDIYFLNIINSKTSNSISIQLNRSNLGGDCPDNENILSTKTFNVLSTNYSVPLCTNKSTNTTFVNPSKGFIIQNTTGSLFKSLLIRFTSSDSTELLTISTILSDIKPLK